MKKKIVLIVLLALPLVLYFYFSMAKHNSLFLPVVTTNVSELPQGTTLNNKEVYLQDKISVVGFLGKDVLRKKESIFNLSQKIYNIYKGFNDFQMVMLAPEGTEEDVKRLISELSVMTDLSGWNFVFVSPEAIREFHSSLKSQQPLDTDAGSYYVYMIDKERSLRGRKGKNNNKGEEEYKDSYNTFSAAELHNEMTDDMKILLREYRLALKKNNEKVIKRQI